MQIYLLFLILLAICTVGIYVNISTKKSNLLLKEIIDILKEKSIKETQPKPNVHGLLKNNYNYDDMLKNDTEEIFFVQEISFNSGKKMVELNIQKPKEKGGKD